MLSPLQANGCKKISKMCDKAAKVVLCGTRLPDMGRGKRGKQKNIWARERQQEQHNGDQSELEMSSRRRSMSRKGTMAVEKNKREVGNDQVLLRDANACGRTCSTLSLVAKLTALAICLHGLYGTTSLPLPPHLEPAGQFQFLTNLALLLTCIVLSLDLVVPSKTPSILLVTIFNLEFVVCSAYWTLHFFFSHYLNAGSFDVSLLLDLEIHFFPYFALALAIFRRKGAPGVSTFRSTVSTLVVLACYFSYIEYMALFHQINYPYPFLRLASAPVRFGWMLVFGAVASSNYLIQKLFI